jgi:FixJ family two-component response regulator
LEFVDCGRRPHVRAVEFAEALVISRKQVLTVNKLEFFRHQRRSMLPPNGIGPVAAPPPRPPMSTNDPRERSAEVRISALAPRGQVILEERSDLRTAQIPERPAVGPGTTRMSDETPTVHVVDDDGSFRNAVGRMLRAAGYEVALYPSADQLLERLPAPARGCILLDVRMPGVSGPQLQERLAGMGNTLPIVFMTGYGDLPTSVRAIKAGAEDFLAKPVSKETLFEAIERALRRYDDAHARHLRLQALQDLTATLTPRERQVFGLVVRGKLNKQIAHELGTSERTIKAHRHSIMHKLKMHSLAELVSMAERLGMLVGSDSP